MQNYLGSTIASLESKGVKDKRIQFLKEIDLKKKIVYYINALENANNQIKIKANSEYEWFEMTINELESQFFNDAAIVEELKDVIYENEVPNVTDLVTAQRKIAQMHKIISVHSQKIVFLAKQANCYVNNIKELVEKENKYKSQIRIQNLIIDNFNTILIQIFQKFDIFKQDVQNQINDFLKEKMHDEFIHLFNSESFVEPIKIVENYLETNKMNNYILCIKNIYEAFHKFGIDKEKENSKNPKNWWKNKASEIFKTYISSDILKDVCIISLTILIIFLLRKLSPLIFFKNLELQKQNIA